jgi:hypothetical protein
MQKPQNATFKTKEISMVKESRTMTPLAFADWPFFEFCRLRFVIFSLEREKYSSHLILFLPSISYVSFPHPEKPKSWLY